MSLGVDYQWFRVCLGWKCCGNLGWPVLAVNRQGVVMLLQLQTRGVLFWNSTLMDWAPSPIDGDTNHPGHQSLPNAWALKGGRQCPSSILCLIHTIQSGLGTVEGSLLLSIFYNLEAKAWAYLVAQLQLKPPAIWKTASNAGESGPIPGWERSLEKAFLESSMDRGDWRIHSMGSQD